MNVSLPALSRFAYTPMCLEPKELKDLMIKHGHKFRDLKLAYSDVFNVLDVCPALNVWAFTLVGPVCLVPLASV
jgi:hypothetical protein